MLPLALLHGFTGTPDNWAGVIDALDPALVVAPVLVGHGPIEGPAPDGFEAEVDRLAAIFASRAPAYHLAGYSLGGRLALGLLARHSHLFRSATVISAHAGLEAESDREARRVSDEKWRTLLGAGDIRPFVDAWESQLLFATQLSVEPAALLAQRRDRLAHDAPGLSESLRVTGLGVMPSYWSALAKVTVPTTLVVGASDEKFHALGRRLVTVLPRATLRVVPDVGHNVLMEAPSAVTAAIRAGLETK